MPNEKTGQTGDSQSMIQAVKDNLDSIKKLLATLSKVWADTACSAGWVSQVSHHRPSAALRQWGDCYLRSFSV